MSTPPDPNSQNLPSASNSSADSSANSSLANPGSDGPPPGGVDRIFIGPDGLRAGWRIAIWMCISIALMAVSVVVVKHIPFLHRQVSGNGSAISTWGLIVSEGSIAWTVLVAALVMAAIEGRKPGVYGMPANQAFKGYFWQGMLWGLAEVSALIGLIAAVHGYSFGSLALDTSGIIKNGILFVIGFFLVGVFEEFTFRGYIQYTLSTGIGFWPSAVILSALFGAIHLGNPGEGWVGALSVFVIGLFFCFTLKRTGNLWFAIGLHCSFDWGETFLYSVPNSGNLTTGALSHSSLHGPAWLTGGTVGPEGSIFCFLTMILDFLIFAMIYRARPALPAASTTAPSISVAP